MIINRLSKYLSISMLSILTLFSFSSNVYPQFQIDLESGGVFSGYNDVRIPGDTGTLFSLSEELEADPTVFFRGRLFYTINSRHTILLLIAPLSVKSTGQIARDINFEGEIFSANTPLDALYRFDSYRFSYQYELYKSQKFELGLGLTAKIRDAEIRLEGGGVESTKTNVGFVPLINFNMHWHFHDKFGLLLDGDALAAPQGRAEDVLAALTYQSWDKLQFNLGYRILEGGADNDEVYGFALFHYIVLGLSLGF